MRKVMVMTTDPVEDGIHGYEVIVEGHNGERTTVVQIPDLVASDADCKTPAEGDVIIPSAFQLAQAVALEIARDNAGIAVWVTDVLPCSAM